MADYNTLVSEIVSRVMAEMQGTTAKEADKIIVLENGKVAEIGTHEQLSKKEGLYKALWDIQGALEEEFLKMVDKEVEN